MTFTLNNKVFTDLENIDKLKSQMKTAKTQREKAIISSKISIFEVQLEKDEPEAQKEMQKDMEMENSNNRPKSTHHFSKWP